MLVMNPNDIIDYIIYMISWTHLIWNITWSHIWYHDVIDLWYHMSGIWYSIWCMLIMSWTHFIWNITWIHTWYYICMLSYMMSYVYEVIYDVIIVMCFWYHMFVGWYSTWLLHSFSAGEMPSQAGSNTGLGRFKSIPIWIKCRPCSEFFFFFFFGSFPLSWEISCFSFFFGTLHFFTISSTRVQWRYWYATPSSENQRGAMLHLSLVFVLNQVGLDIKSLRKSYGWHHSRKFQEIPWPMRDITLGNPKAYGKSHRWHHSWKLPSM